MTIPPLQTPGSRRRPTELIFFLMWIGAIVGFVVGIFVHLDQTRFAQEALVATGTVVKREQTVGSKRQTYYYITYEFEAGDPPIRYSAQQGVGGIFHNTHPEGSPVEVTYDPNNPQNSVIEPDTTLTKGIFIVIGSAVAWLTLSGVWLYAGMLERRLNPQPPAPGI